MKRSQYLSTQLSKAWLGDLRNAPENASAYVGNLPLLRSPALTAISLITALVLAGPRGFATQPLAASGQIEATAEEFARAGLEFASARRFDEAIQEFNRGLAMDPANPVLLNATGIAFNLKGDTQQAESYFMKALAVDSAFLPARKNLAITYFESRNYDLAVAHFEVLSRNSKTRPIALMFLGMVADRKRQYEKAARLFEGSGDLVFQYGKAVVSFAHSLWSLGDEKMAQLVLARLSTAPNVTADDWLAGGLTYATFGQYQNALEFYDRAKVANSQLAEVDYQRALALDKLGRSKESLAILQQLASGKANASSLNVLAHVAENAGEINLAIQSYCKAAELEPANENNYLDYSTLAMDHQNDSLALEIIDVGLFYLPKSYRLNVQKGVVLTKLGRVAEAEKQFRAAQGFQAYNRDALLCLARLQESGQHYQNSLRTLRIAIRKFPTDFYLHYYYAFVLRQAGENADETLQSVNRSIQLNPSFASSYLLRGQIYRDRDLQLAARQFEKCLHLDPQNDSAKYQLARLWMRMGKREEAEELSAQVQKDKLEEDEKEKTASPIVKQ